MPPGPIPNREADLSRPRKRQGKNQPNHEVTRGVARPVVVPQPDPNWHPIAKMVWESLAVSGQTDFYQQSDWAFAYSVCEDLSAYKTPISSKDGYEYVKRSGQMLQTIYSAMERLLITEGDRRRVRIELDAPPKEEQSAALYAIEQYREELNKD